MWLNIELSRKITTMRTTPVVFSHRKHVKNPQNRCFVMCTDGTNKSWKIPFFGTVYKENTGEEKEECSERPLSSFRGFVMP